MNIAIESVIVSLLGFFSCIVFIACKPSGVAALPIPRRFAIIFIVIKKIGIKNKGVIFMLNAIIVILLIIGGYTGVVIGCLALCSIPFAIFLNADTILYKIRRSK